MIQLASSLSDEINELHQTYPNVIVQTSTPSFLTASYQRTPYTRIKFTLTFPEGYPDHPLIVDIKQDEVVPPGLKRKLEQELLDPDLLPLGHYQQVMTVVTKLVQFVNQNKFLPCWKELKQVMNLINNGENSNSTGVESSTISIVESKGTIKLKLYRKKYFYNCTITVDDGYPSTTTHEDWGKACVLKVISTNFPHNIEHMLTSQAIEVVRRMQDGMTAEKAMVLSNPIRQPKHHHLDDNNGDKKHSNDELLTRDQLKNLKHDIDTLSNVRDLREKDAEKIQGNAHILKQHTKERKAARRAIHRISDKELAADQALEQQQEQETKHWREEEKARLAGYYNSHTHEYFPPQPSLLSLVIFLKEKIQMLPDAKCPCCQSPALPSDPTLLEAMYHHNTNSQNADPKRRKEAKAMRPMRCYCGCWYHYKCLDKYMREPPFGASCPTKGCGRQVFHPHWPSDRKQLEREWAGHQARLREIDDAAMFL